MKTLFSRPLPVTRALSGRLLPGVLLAVGAGANALPNLARAQGAEVTKGVAGVAVVGAVAAAANENARPLVKPAGGDANAGQQQSVGEANRTTEAQTRTETRVESPAERAARVTEEGRALRQEAAASRAGGEVLRNGRDVLTTEAIQNAKDRQSAVGVQQIQGGSPASAEATEKVPGTASAAVPPKPANRKKICLVLSGGGARGLAHVGVLKVLERLRVPVDCVTGTSMGAIVGGLYASGMSADELEQRLSKIDLATIPQDRVDRRAVPFQNRQNDYEYPLPLQLGFRNGKLQLPTGAYGGTSFELLLRDLTSPIPGDLSFDRLPVPFRAVATDLENGKMVVFDKGPLSQAIRASMSVPGLFAPIEVNGHLMADGGLVRNLPVDVARNMGADAVIAVNIGTPLSGRDDLNSIIGVTAQMINILTEQNVQQQISKLQPADTLIMPDLGTLTSADFGEAVRAIKLGEDAATAQAASLARYSLSEDEYRRHLAAQPAYRTPTGRLAFVEAETKDYVPPAAVVNASGLKPGDPLDFAEFNKGMTRLQATGDFQTIGYTLLTREDGERGLKIDATEKPWGPNFFRVGLGLYTDFETLSTFSLSIGHQWKWINHLGGNWRNDVTVGPTQSYRTEFLQPFRLPDPDTGQMWFVAPNFEASRRLADTYIDNQRRGRYRELDVRLGLDLGLNLNRRLSLRAGLGTTRVDGEPDIAQEATLGSRELQPVDLKNTGFRFSGVYDTLDNPTFPTDGQRAVLRAEVPFNRDDRRYTRLDADGQAAFTSGANTLQLAASGGWLDRQDQRGAVGFRLGGFQRLSGYHQNEFEGDRMAFGRAVVLRRLTEFSPFNLGLYGGASLEAGQVWGNGRSVGSANGGVRAGGSVFVGTDTGIGPFYLAYGFAGGRHQAVYLFLGRP